MLMATVMTTDEGSTRREHAAAEWSALRDRLRTVTPQAIGRAVLALAAIGVAVWLSIASWPAVLPFVVGGLVAYQLLPVVDALDRVMPRALAALASVLVAIGAIVGVLVIVLPPLTRAFVRFAVDLPTAADIDAAISNLQKQVGSLPEGSADVVVPVVTTLAATVRDTLAGAAGGLDDIVRAGLAALLAAFGALLGLIVLPTWMLVLMSHKERARIAIDARITPGLRGDLWAIAAIVDRAAGAYLRGYIVTGLLVGLFAYIGVTLSPIVGGPRFGEPLAIATFAGVTQVVPVVGALLGLLPAVLILALSPERAAVYIAIYFVARYLGGSVLGSRMMGRGINVHPAILVPGVVMIGQFGVLWLLLSAPIVAILVDLVRYFSGRLAEPPQPAGVLPGATAPAATIAASRSVPLAYRPAAAPPSLAGGSAQPAPPVA
jgi:predicted PurR-regulated permease PerM